MRGLLHVYFCAFGTYGTLRQLIKESKLCYDAFSTSLFLSKMSRWHVRWADEEVIEPFIPATPPSTPALAGNIDLPSPSSISSTLLLQTPSDSVLHPLPLHSDVLDIDLAEPPGLDIQNCPAAQTSTNETNSPTISTVNFIISDLLLYKDGDPPLLWDVSVEPSIYSVRTPEGSPITEEELSVPCIYPDRPSIRVHCVPVGYWLPLCIEGSIFSPTGRNGLATPTVLDVLQGVYRFLNKRIRSLEFSDIQPPALRNEISRSFYRRCRRYAETTVSSQTVDSVFEEHKKQGLKRVDFLLGRTKFLGLSPAWQEAGVWSLETAIREG